MASGPPHERKQRRRRMARRTYLALATVFLGAIVIQVFLAGGGIFSSALWLERHVAFVEWFQPIPLFLLLVAFLGHMERFAKLAPAAAFIALVLQYEFADASPNVVAGLHAVNALFLFWLASEMVRRSWRVRS